MIVARADGILASVHAAPPTQTRSVHSNPAMEERQRLTALLGIETFQAAASQAVAAASLCNPKAPANPDVPLQHPHEIFMFAANPGGRWRLPLEPGSSLPVLDTVENVRSRLRFAAHLGRCGRREEP